MVPPPGMGFVTAMGKETGVATSVVNNVTCRCPASTNVLGREPPETVPYEDGLKPEPEIVTVSGPTPDRWMPEQWWKVLEQDWKPRRWRLRI